MSSHSARVRVRYAETDQMGVVYHANYIVWMEVGRVEYCRSQGISYREMEAAGIRLAVVDVGCRFLSPARYDDEVEIETTIVKANARMVEFGYIMREVHSGRKLAEGSSKHLFLDANMKPVRLLPDYYLLFGLA